MKAEPCFEVADEEFRSAVNECGNGGYADRPVKRGSVFESVLKVMRESDGRSFDERDAAGRLTRTVVERSPLDSFFREPLALMETMRNRARRPRRRSAYRRRAGESGKNRGLIFSRRM